MVLRWWCVGQSWGKRTVIRGSTIMLMLRFLWQPKRLHQCWDCACVSCWNLSHQEPIPLRPVDTIEWPMSNTQGILLEGLCARNSGALGQYHITSADMTQGCVDSMHSVSHKMVEPPRHKLEEKNTHGVTEEVEHPTDYNKQPFHHPKEEFNSFMPVHEAS